MITLFPDQDVLADAVRGALGRGVTRVLAQAPTGFGKTILFSYIVSRARERGKRVGVFAHRAELLSQISDALKMFKVPHGVISAGCTPDRRHTVHVISAQTYARRVDRMPTFDLAIIDEAHHCTAGSTWGKCMEASPQAKWIGVTATPERLDGRGLSESFEELILGPTVRDLIDAKRLSDYRLFAPRGMDVSEVHTLGGDFKRDELAAAADKSAITGDAIKHYRKHLDGAPTAAFCVSIAHAEHVAEQFRDAGYISAHIDGKMDRLDRARIVRDFRAGQINVLTSCDLLSEGFDVPGMHGAILLRPTKSLSLYLQQVGRALRVAPGKDKATILDHANNSDDNRHGLPCLERDWSLEGRRKAKAVTEASTYRECGKCFSRFRISLSVCPECQTPMPVRVREIEQVEGELEEVNTAERRVLSPERIAQGRAKGIADLMALGHSEGRAKHILEAREEKKRLQDQLIGAGWKRSEVWAMKPKALREALNGASVS